MQKPRPDMTQVFELLRSSHERLLISHAINRDTRDCLKKTKQLLEASKQLILRSDALVQRIRPVDLSQHARSDSAGGPPLSML
jgi:hypothetical protein